VAFTHPISRERVTIEAPLPRDLACLIKAVHFPDFNSWYS
jgi:hypothetical protein